MRHEVKEGGTVWEDGAVRIDVVSAQNGQLVVEVTAKPPIMRNNPPLPEVDYLDEPPTPPDHLR